MLQAYWRRLTVYRFEFLGVCDRIEHVITSRHGGCSVGPFQSFNLGYAVGDDPQTVTRNRELLASALRISPADFVLNEQEHGNRIRVIKGDSPKKLARPIEPEIADAIVTDVPGICLMVLVADCVPLLFCDPVRNVIAIAHA
ncbi:MAG: laccase domain-containing protein, partial [Candidatus Zixiibacteriota bacterium]